MNLNEALQVVRYTDIGQRRDHNEDAVASDISIGLLILADGMGGYKAGEVASEMAVLTLIAELKEAITEQSVVAGFKDLNLDAATESMLLIDAVNKANEVIFQVSQTQPRCSGMGTTLVACVFTDNKILVGHVGDSRLYRLRKGELAQITEDHSLVQEQIKAGLMTAAQAKVSINKNLVTRALGIDAKVELELHEYAVEQDDIYLLCSDGLSDLVEDEDIRLTLIELSANLESMAEKLINMANNNGGKDNISVVIAKVVKPFPLDQSKLQRFLGWLK